MVFKLADTNMGPPLSSTPSILEIEDSYQALAIIMMVLDQELSFKHIKWMGSRFRKCVRLCIHQSHIRLYCIQGVPNNVSDIGKSETTRDRKRLNIGIKNLTNVSFTTSIFQYGHQL